MPSFELETTIPLRVHPQATELESYHINWLREMGLMSDTEAEQSYLQQGAVRLVIYTFPQIPYVGLCLATDMIGIAAIVDDYCSSHVNETEQVTKLIHSLINITEDPVEQHHDMNNPMLRSWLNTWQRYSDGMVCMSDAWQRKTRATWQSFLQSWIDESRMHASDAPITLERYLPLRRRAISVRAFVDVAQWATRLELPPHLAEHPMIQDILDTCTDICFYTNDIFSLEREILKKEKHNAVLLVQKEGNLSIEQAINLTINKCIDTYHVFEAQKHNLSLLVTSTHEQQTVDSFVDLLCSCIKGNHHWSTITPRYKTTTLSPSPELYLSKCEYLSNT
ncbi:MULTISPECIES: terpene synthase family protein [unclassified Pseudomonas]|jgi:hypothetical protein|uniref:terpene synthase family protein n=1 Tax=unclassified Pseudomonas TaxID=196821 RepID=UPI000C2FD563|nr:MULTISPECIES: terpene synthase family protein [unclassified Pseudomonas]MCU1738317.1 terpene synthase family protein [Pseudomonas sp. 20S_6.2_Bac1]